MVILIVDVPRSQISSPTPGTFIIALHYKGREKAILEMDLKIDDLLEKVSTAIVAEQARLTRTAIQRQEGVTSLDLEYVSLSIEKTLALLNKTFKRK